MTQENKEPEDITVSLEGRLLCSMRDLQKALDVGHTKSYDLVRKGLSLLAS